MSDTVYVLDQVGIRLVKEKTLISDTQLKRPEQVVGFVSDILREYDREVMCVICLNAKLQPVNMCICLNGGNRQSYCITQGNNEDGNTVKCQWLYNPSQPPRRLITAFA